MESIWKSNRIIYVDILRILSILAVIVLHITADLLTRTNDFDTSSWWVSNIFNSVSRFAVPVFFMISGAMMLRVNITTYRDFYIKRVLPLVIALVSWSLIYALYNQYVIVNSKMNALAFLQDFGYKLLTDGNYVHLWFLYAIIAIYMTIPLISKLVKTCSEKDLRYYLSWWAAISIGYRFISDIIVKLTGQYINIPLLNIPLFTGFLGYFILGHYLFTYGLPDKWKQILFNLGIVSFFLTPVATYFASRHLGILDETFYGNYSITTFFMAVAMFIWFKEKEPTLHERVNYKLQKMIGSISKASFSIYLIHLLIELLVSRRAETEASLLQTSSNLVFNVIAVFTVSYLLVKMLNLSKVMTTILFGGKG
ncbi:acyltransferase [Paenibacillus popilliae]|uniref:acyltransferase n=1 Tax=Paenibacillus popilliae TaxID=78057 RepID=UPI00163BB890|nr:acyltransferase family protein [Paenibacillus sp. SDF0028]